MLIELAVYYLTLQGVQASQSASSRVIEPSAPQTCNNPIPCRSVSNIVYSCFATLFICIWVAVHPNIPAPDETRFAITLRRSGLMLLALIAPELITAWAVRQLLVARKLKKEFQDHRWTLVHGFFALMGGFMAHEDDQVRTISIRELKSHRQNNMTGVPVEQCQFDVSEDDIEDKSKGDALSKGLAIVQTAWFALQCGVRKSQHLPLTELELITLAFTMLNVINYMLWWCKPLNIERSTLIARQLTRCKYQEGKRMGLWPGIKVACRDTIEDTRRSFRNHGWLAIPHIIYINNIAIVNLFHAIFGLVEREGKPVVTFRDATKETLKEPEGDNLKYPGARVPTFYAGFLTSDELRLARCASAVVATIFGLIHCIAWSFQFPSYTEQMLWRAASVVITVMPLQTLVASWLFSNERYEGINALLSFPFGSLYLFARLALLVLPFLSLRLLPPGTLEGVRWIDFIAHIY